MFGFYVDSQPYVVIADYDVLKDVLKRDDASGRPDSTPLNELRAGHWTVPKDNEGRPPGITFSQGNYWKEQRRFLLRNLRDFGFGKIEMEDTILDEVEKLCAEYSKLEGKPFCLDNTLNLSVVNALWVILTGEKLPLKNPKLLKIVSDINNSVKKIKSNLNLLTPISPKFWMRQPRAQDRVGLSAWRYALQNMTAIIQDQAEEHKSTINPDMMRDMIDLCLTQIETTYDVNSSYYKDRGHFAMINSFIDLFVAGMETTSSSLLWTFLYLIHYPDIKTKIYIELDQVIWIKLSR